jgi:hypothetical protein
VTGRDLRELENFLMGKSPLSLWGLWWELSRGLGAEGKEER